MSLTPVVRRLVVDRTAPSGSQLTGDRGLQPGGGWSGAGGLIRRTPGLMTAVS